MMKRCRRPQASEGGGEPTLHLPFIQSFTSFTVMRMREGEKQKKEQEKEEEDEEEAAVIKIGL